LHINFSQSLDHNGLEIINLNFREESRIHFVLQVKISGGGVRDAIILDNIIIGLGERKFKSLYPVTLEGCSSIYFNGTIRAVGFDNVPLIPKTELRGGIGPKGP